MKKLNRVFILLIPFIFISCATILNPSIQKIKITSDKSITNIIIDSAKNNIKDKNNYYVLRDKRPLVVRFRHDTSNYEIILTPKKSSSLYFNSYPGCWPGFLIDKKKPVSYTYPKHTHIEFINDTIKTSRFAPPEKGTLNWVLSFPYINNYHIKTDNSFQNSFGFLGLGVGIEYYYRNNKYLSINTGGATDFFIPFPAPYDNFGSEFHVSSTFYINIKDNFTVKRFDFGYGLSYSNFNWKWSKGWDSTAVSRSKFSYNLGICLEGLYRFSDYFRMGLLYQPNFIDMTHKPTLEYQHFISIEFIWKFPLS